MKSQHKTSVIEYKILQMSKDIKNLVYEINSNSIVINICAEFCKQLELSGISINSYYYIYVHL